MITTYQLNDRCFPRNLLSRRKEGVKDCLRKVLFLFIGPVRTTQLRLRRYLPSLVDIPLCGANHLAGILVYALKEVSIGVMAIDVEQLLSALFTSLGRLMFVEHGFHVFMVVGKGVGNDVKDSRNVLLDTGLNFHVRHGYDRAKRTERRGSSGPGVVKKRGLRFGTGQLCLSQANLGCHEVDRNLVQHHVGH
jgi:hypothetical protein